MAKIYRNGVEIGGSSGGGGNTVHFIGTTTTALTDGASTSVIVIGGLSYTVQNGDMVKYNTAYFIWDATATEWHEIGGGGPSTDTLAFIRTIYDANHRVTASKGNTTLQSDLSGEYVFPIPELGAWELTNEDGHTDIVVTEYGHEYQQVLHNNSLPYSDPSDILISTWASESSVHYNDSQPAWTWDDLVFYGTLTNISYNQAEQSLYIPSNVYCEYALPDINTSVTVYIVAKPELVNTSISNACVALKYAASPGNMPAFIYTYSSGIQYTVWGSDSIVDVNDYPPDDWHVLALTLDMQNKNALFFVDGIKMPVIKQFNNSGSTVTIGGTSGNVYDASLFVKYFGVVDGYETDDTIMSNSKAIMEDVGIPVCKLTIWYDPGYSVQVHDSVGQMSSNAYQNSHGLANFSIPRIGLWTAETNYSLSETVAISDQSNVVICFEADMANHLPSSIKSNIIGSYDTNNLCWYEDKWHFGYRTKFFGTESYIALDNNEDAVHFSQQVSPYITLGSSNTDHEITAYAVVKGVQTLSGDLGVLIMGSYPSSGNMPGFFTRSGYIWTTVYGNDANTGESLLNWHVLTVSVKIDTSSSRNAYYYIDGVQIHSPKAINPFRPTAVVGAFNNGDAMSDLLVKYFGVVDGYESPETIIANHQHLMEEFGISGS